MRGWDKVRGNEGEGSNNVGSHIQLFYSVCFLGEH